MNRLEWQWQRFPYSSTETHGIFKTALTFVDHVSEIWGPLLNGQSLVCVPREVTKNPEMLIPLLEKFEVDFIILQLLLLLQFTHSMLPSSATYRLSVSYSFPHYCAPL